MDFQLFEQVKIAGHTPKEEGQTGAPTIYGLKNDQAMSEPNKAKPLTDFSKKRIVALDAEGYGIKEIQKEMNMEVTEVQIKQALGHYEMNSNSNNIEEHYD